MTENAVFEVIEKEYIVTGGSVFRENRFKKDEHIIARDFYASKAEAKRHVKWWAEVNGTKPFVGGNNARVTKETNPHDWEDYLPEFKVMEISIVKHELRGYFYVRTA